MLETLYVTLVQSCTGGLAYKGEKELRSMVKSRITKWELLAAHLFTPTRLSPSIFVLKTFFSGFRTKNGILNSIRSSKFDTHGKNGRLAEDMAIEWKLTAKTAALEIFEVGYT